MSMHLTLPQLARHFGCCETPVRRWLHQFAAERLKPLCHRRRGLNGLLSQSALGRTSS